ncbi:hypothetical protein MES4922_410012 [Mesorhizobium ventifaucium]|uniref:Propionyl-coenzyme A carboxylase alpha polypeptide n=1 Tax=Mesorhizobium ventifaucium TaxID=666020 RepID=A0ABM9EAP7_9HYPH|nr:hypothetical protein MES4922_410012 [Mesorhizobium ventifaucium]
MGSPALCERVGSIQPERPLGDIHGEPAIAIVDHSARSKSLSASGGCAPFEPLASARAVADPDAP